MVNATGTSMLATSTAWYLLFFDDTLVVVVAAEDGPTSPPPGAAVFVIVDIGMVRSSTRVPSSPQFPNRNDAGPLAHIGPTHI
jgi:hypothetical protein